MNSLASSARMLFRAALLIFVVTIVIGILNGMDVWDPPHNLLMTHVHAGMLGWITLAVVGAAMVMFDDDRAEPASGRSLAGAAIAATVLYVGAFALTTGIQRPMTGVLMLAAIVWVLGVGVGALRAVRPLHGPARPGSVTRFAHDRGGARGDTRAVHRPRRGAGAELEHGGGDRRGASAGDARGLPGPRGSRHRPLAVGRAPDSAGPVRDVGTVRLRHRRQPGVHPRHRRPGPGRHGARGRRDRDVPRAHPAQPGAVGLGRRTGRAHTPGSGRCSCSSESSCWSTWSNSSWPAS